VVYLFFILNIPVYAWFNSKPTTRIARAYFIWVSVFVLFVVAVSESMAVVQPRTAGRLFGFVAGLSLGGLFGPFLGKQSRAARHHQPAAGVSRALTLAPA
jgi:hypothetical protein